MTPGVAASECIELVREAVAMRRAARAATRHPEARPDRVPECDWRTWYERAEAAVEALDAGREVEA